MSDMKTIIPYDDPEVLRTKYRGAQALVEFYEKKIAKLRSLAQLAMAKGVKPSDLRSELFTVTEEILRSEFSSSSICEDHGRVVARIGRRFERKLDEAYSTWSSFSEEIVEADNRIIAPDDERLRLAGFAMATANMFVVGIEPVQILRDEYADQLKFTMVRHRKKRGRPADTGKAARDKQIAAEYRRLGGKPGQRRRVLSEKYGLEVETIRKIVQQQQHAPL